jgi:protein-tyrosine phosphatase
MTAAWCGRQVAAYRRRARAVQNEAMTGSPERAHLDSAPHGDGRRWRLCFVCTGNICRSPMAEVVLGRLARDTVTADGRELAGLLDISSAGTGGWHAGEPMDPRARAALEQRGYEDHGHRARPFRTSWFASTDLVVCMDRGHQQTLLSLARRKAGDERYDPRLVMLRGFDARAGGAVDVPDPYYGEQADFESCLSLVESGCRGLVDHLVDHLAGLDLSTGATDGSDGAVSGT